MQIENEEAKLSLFFHGMSLYMKPQSLNQKTLNLIGTKKKESE